MSSPTYVSLRKTLTNLYLSPLGPRASSPVRCLFGVAADVTLPRSSPADPPFRLHDPRRGGLSWGFQTTPPRRTDLIVSCPALRLSRWAWALGADSGVRPHVHPLCATQPQL
jgi:hypothetical protein